jgi:hypothetical protein
LGVNLKFKENQVGIILGGKTIFNTFSVRLSSHLLWNKDAPITISITNLTEKEVVIPQQWLITAYIVEIKGERDLKIEMAKIIKRNKDNPSLNGAIPEKLAQKFLETKVIPVQLPKHNEVSRQPENENLLLKQADHYRYSATSFMLSVGDQVRPVVNLYAYENRAHMEHVK